MWTTLLALRNSIAILMASLAVVVLGFVALGRLPVDLFPNINPPIINVGTVYTGAGVLDVENLPDREGRERDQRRAVRRVQVASGAVDGAGVDELGADVNDGQTEVIQRIQQILNTLPGHQAAVHRPLWPVEHPGGADHRLRRPSRRAAAL